jgi:hypothetical protein
LDKELGAHLSVFDGEHDLICSTTASPLYHQGACTQSEMGLDWIGFDFDSLGFFVQGSSGGGGQKASRPGKSAGPPNPILLDEKHILRDPCTIPQCLHRFEAN